MRMARVYSRRRPGNNSDPSSSNAAFTFNTSFTPINATSRDPQIGSTGPSNSSARSSVGASSVQSTSPTSLGDASSEVDASKDDTAAIAAPATTVSQNSLSRKSTRPRTSIGTYNDKVNTGTAVHTRTQFLQAGNLPGYQAGNLPSYRTVSGATLVDDTRDEPRSAKRMKKNSPGLDLDWDMPSKKAGEDALERMDRLQRSKSAKYARMQDLAENYAAAVAESFNKQLRECKAIALREYKSVLGKRARIALGSREVADDDDEDEDLEPATKKSRLPQKCNNPRQKENTAEEGSIFAPRTCHRRKKYLDRGLYVGQFRKLGLGKTKSKKPPGMVAKSGTEESSVLPLPMFTGEKRLKEDQDFVLPFEILNPLPRDQAPKDWSKLNRNIFKADARATWEKKGNAKLDSSICPCWQTANSCSESCINRTMQYECNELNCKLGVSCGNRAFAELKFRSKNKNFSRRRDDEKPDQNLWGEGVEVLKTEDRGFGVRAMRSFEPGQIIVEYCGEIITQEECDRRMNEDYKYMTDYYLMTFHDKMIIDATRGSIARFVNHSCEPNCTVEKWTVDSIPRMALFAGEHGIQTGEELTYDYNFEAFSKKNIQTCLCGARNCRGVLGPKPAKETKAAKALAAASEAYRGVKRKVKDVFAVDDDDEEDFPRLKRHKTTLSSGATLVKKALFQRRTDSSTQRPVNTSNESRKEAHQTASVKSLQSDKETERRSLSSSLTLADLNRSKKANKGSAGWTPKQLYENSQKMSDHWSGISFLRAKGAPGLKFRAPAVEPPLIPVDTTSTVARKVSSSVSWTPYSRPSKASNTTVQQVRDPVHTHASWAYVSPLEAPPTKEDEMRAIVSGKLVIPKRKSSIAACTKSSSSTAKDVTGCAKDTGLEIKGRSTRKSIRVVSEADQ